MPTSSSFSQICFLRTLLCLSLRRTEKETVLAWLKTPHRCPGLLYGTSAQDGFLIRIRTPGGVIAMYASSIDPILESDA
jgi:hypothetical protein